LKEAVSPLATKVELQREVERLATKLDLKNETSRLDLGLSNLEHSMSKLKGDLELKISDFKSDILRWMFALFLTMILAILGLYFKK